MGLLISLFALGVDGNSRQAEVRNHMFDIQQTESSTGGDGAAPPTLVLFWPSGTSPPPGTTPWLRPCPHHHKSPLKFISHAPPSANPLHPLLHLQEDCVERSLQCLTNPCCGGFREFDQVACYIGPPWPPRRGGFTKLTMGGGTLGCAEKSGVVVGVNGAATTLAPFRRCRRRAYAWLRKGEEREKGTDVRRKEV
jgi:hypothetical protein